MAHYAFLNSDNVVVEVITGKNENNGTDWETYYSNIRGLTCKRTSYNTYANVHANGGTPFRKNFAGVGYKYDSTLDAFIPPKPYDSWTLNNSIGLWEAPVAYPDDGNIYRWNETNQTWEQE